MAPAGFEPHVAGDALVNHHGGTSQGGSMATPERRYGPAGGLTLGGIIVILGIVLIFAWSFWWGLIIALVGLIFFGGFARGRWY
jgi:hypothetical protein